MHDAPAQSFTERDISDWTIGERIAYHLGQADLTVKRSYELEKDIDDTRLKFESQLDAEYDRWSESQNESTEYSQ